MDKLPSKTGTRPARTCRLQLEVIYLIRQHMRLPAAWSGKRSRHGFWPPREKKNEARLV